VHLVPILLLHGSVARRTIGSKKTIKFSKSNDSIVHCTIQHLYKEDSTILIVKGNDFLEKILCYDENMIKELKEEINYCKYEREYIV